MNSRLLNVSTIFVAVVAVSVGIFVYNSAQTTITDSMESISSQEVDAYNQLFTSYNGNQTGSSIKGLIGRLIVNATTYENEVEKIPGLVMEKIVEDEFIIQDEVSPLESLDVYIQKLSEIRNEIDSRHDYYVEITYQENGFIDYIHVSYDEFNPITDLKYR